MATINDILKFLGGGAAQAVPAIQQGIQNYAMTNPVAAGNILNATGGGFGSMIQQAPVQVLSKLIGPSAQNIIQPPPATIVRAQAPTTVQRATTPPAPVVQSKSFGQISGATPARVAIPQATTTQQPARVNITAAKPVSYTTPYDQYLAQAKEAMRPYYEKLLANSNWDINNAKKKLEEDYQLGKRQAEAGAAADTSTLFGQQIPQEQMQEAENLNKRGLLTTPEGSATQIQGTNPTTGQVVTPTNPYLTKKYGGIAGNQIGQMQTGQQARAEAIGRALSNREASLQLPVTQQNRYYDEQQKRNTYELGQKQNIGAATLAGEKYANQLQKQQAGLQTAYSQ